MRWFYGFPGCKETFTAKEFLTCLREGGYKRAMEYTGLGYTTCALKVAKLRRNGYSVVVKDARFVSNAPGATVNKKF